MEGWMMLMMPRPLNVSVCQKMSKLWHGSDGLIHSAASQGRQHEQDFCSAHRCLCSKMTIEWLRKQQTMQTGSYKSAEMKYWLILSRWYVISEEELFSLININKMSSCLALY